MANQLLLLKDVEHLGRSGDLVKVKPGYARNYLFPKMLAAIADRSTLRKRDKLQKERAALAARDLSESQEIAAKLSTLQISIEVKVDQEGHMYGSVSSGDILTLLTNQGYSLDRRSLSGFKPVKKVGLHTILAKLKEGVIARFTLQVLAEGQNAESEPDANAAPENTSPGPQTR